MQLLTKKKRNIEINVAPLIDVVFLLLIFFMLASEFTDFKTIDMISPNQSKVDQPESNLPLIVNLSEKGVITIDTKEVSFNKLAQTIKDKLNNKKETKIIISTPNETKVKILIKIVDTIRGLGIENIALITKDKK
jgi:biopolymer transport protein ExbD